MTDAQFLFDRRAVRRHRDRAARRPVDPDRSPDFLHDEVAGRLVERLDEVNRDFAEALDLGCRRGTVARALLARSGMTRVVQADLSPGMARAARQANRFVPTVVADEERLPFRPGSFDLVAANLSLHWVNDLPGALIQIRQALRPDGLFLGTLFGGGTLMELRDVLMEAELATTGGAGPRVSPFTDVRDAGGLLQRAGFALPMVDRDTITVTYEHALSLMYDLRHMGETQAMAERRKSFTRRDTLLAAHDLFLQKHADKAGRLVTRFEILYLTGWAPAETQPKPLRPGSATESLADALGTRERPLEGD